MSQGWFMHEFLSLCFLVILNLWPQFIFTLKASMLMLWAAASTPSLTLYYYTSISSSGSCQHCLVLGACEPSPIVSHWCHLGSTCPGGWRPPVQNLHSHPPVVCGLLRSARQACRTLTPSNEGLLCQWKCWDSCVWVCVCFRDLISFISNKLFSWLLIELLYNST